MLKSEFKSETGNNFVMMFLKMAFIAAMVTSFLSSKG